MYFARFVTPRSETYAFGDTIQNAMKGLIEIWRTSMIYHGGDIDYMLDHFEDIEIFPANLNGPGMSLASTDQFWSAQINMNEVKQDFFDVWDHVATTANKQTLKTGGS